MANETAKAILLASAAYVFVTTPNSGRPRLFASFVAAVYCNPHFDMRTGVFLPAGGLEAGADIHLIIARESCCLHRNAGIPCLEDREAEAVRQVRNAQRFVKHGEPVHRSAGHYLLDRSFAGDVTDTTWQHLPVQSGDSLTLKPHHFLSPDAAGHAPILEGAESPLPDSPASQVSFSRISASHLPRSCAIGTELTTLGSQPARMTIRVKVDALRYELWEQAKKKVHALAGDKLSEADAFVAIIDNNLRQRAAGEGEAAQNVDASLYQVVVGLNPSRDEAYVETDDGPVPIPTSLAETIACDAPVIMAGEAKPEPVGKEDTAEPTENEDAAGPKPDATPVSEHKDGETSPCKDCREKGIDRKTLAWLRKLILVRMALRSAEKEKLTLEAGAATVLAKASHGTAREIFRLFARVRDAAVARKRPVVDASFAKQVLKDLGIDERGLGPVHRRIIDALKKAGRRALSLSRLASAARVSLRALRDIYEPDLTRLGLLAVTSRGRVLTI